MSEEIIISGPEIDFEVKKESFGKQLIERLKSHPKNHVIQVNGETGEQQTVEEFLKSGFQVGAGLRSLGIKKGDVIALVANYSSKAFATLLGGFAIAAPVFPINPSFKTWELKNLFYASEPKIVLCEKQCTQHVIEALDLLQNKAIVVVLNGESSNPKVKEFSEILKEVEVDIDFFEVTDVENPKEELALIICSSGTTGLPKACAMSHWALSFGLGLYEDMPDFCAKLPYLQVTHLFWATGLIAFLSSCYLGTQRIYVANVNATSLLHAIHNYKPGWVFMAPIYLSWIINHPDFKKHDVTSLKHISVGGSSLPQAIADLMKKKWPVPVEFYQSFGMTEFGMHAVKPSGKYITSAGLIGQKGIKMKVVDTNTGKTLGPNQIGELRFYHEHSIMKGYLKNEEATREAFDESGFYKTGDLGYYTEDKHLFITSRIKDLIKCNNHQISPAELEDVILSLPEVEDVAVLGVPHEAGQYRPFALVMKKKNAEITEKAIIDYVAEKMSKEKHVYGVKFVELIPRNASGKILRPKLKELL